MNMTRASGLPSPNTALFLVWHKPQEVQSPYLTIAGQTAPGAGVTIQGLTFSADSTHGAVEHARDEVVRFIRCRPGEH